jgi:hypothetical protein
VGTSYCAVRFADGEVRIGLYQDTSDILNPRLFTVGQMEEWWRSGQTGQKLSDQTPDEWWKDEVGPNWEAVEIACPYGGGFRWLAEATKGRVHPRWLDPFAGGTDSDGLPRWWPLEVYDPEWYWSRSV